ncbi:hypothetical protein FDF31_14115 [Clostridium sporogenes]|uniref:hypothetical protein n=1 Tax=unclassified Clostridium TaxID=2614128 RepID=UPI0006ABBA93|nr:hypothetical protein [Clostridium sp. L74]EJP6471134.1 hypothetical protein [Clostridium botulinum]KOR23931.1 hypothetical protein ND00_32080 [Clostridium sp. L74]NFN87428.1 hypothetical protein [Clostridium sporogenes]NFS26718.1 hypothetical protein [Clostridium sporogenes]
MIHFKTMWDDVCSILNHNEIENLEILESFKTGFIVKTENGTEFITRDDFVDFWCHMLCFNKITEMDIDQKGKERRKCICNIIKNLPYINANNGVITLVEQ